MSLPLLVIQEKVALFRKDWKDAVGEEIHEDRITCKDCTFNDNCDYAWDPYNTDGDCLDLK